MYKIMRGNKRFNSKTFDSYEKARSYVRKWIRDAVKKGKVNTQILYDISDLNYYNPSISLYNFNIKAI